jgi:pyruvate kinase
MKIKILCTLGPASLDTETISRLAVRGVDIFRINLSHTVLEAVESTIGLIRSVTTVPICLDTEGPQVRCGPIADDVVLEEGREVRLTPEIVRGNEAEITLWPKSVFDVLDVDSVVAIDFDGALLRITARKDDVAMATVVAGGRVRSNKAAAITPAPVLPALSEKDLAAIEIGSRQGIVYYALSFASKAEDVSRLRQLAPPGAHIIAKIESRAGVRNRDGIMSAADSVLIDRGDLSREIALEHVPYYQKVLIRQANRWNRPVYVATNLLESMVTNRMPTIAEANDIMNTLLDGTHGLVLAAETAIGADPVGSVDFVLRAIGAFSRASESHLLAEDQLETDSLTGGT